LNFHGGILMTDLAQPVIDLCIAGAQAEFAGRWEEACALYRQAWQRAADDFGACVAAHYRARCQTTPQARLAWHQQALARAQATDDPRVEPFWPSLWVNLGFAHEQMGEEAEAQRWYRAAAGRGLYHDPGPAAVRSSPPTFRTGQTRQGD
jgi:tetratricopeptide (TPR) repeat protein